MRRALLLLLLLAIPAEAAAATLAQRIRRAARRGGTVAVHQSVEGFAVSVRIPRGATLRLRATRPVTLDGGGADIGLRVESGGRLVLSGPITFQNYALNAIRATLCESVTLRGVTFRDTGQSAVLTGKTRRVRIEGCDVSDSAGHGFYVSEGGRGVVIRGNRVRNCAKIGIHVNGCIFRTHRVRVLNNTITDCGTAAVQLAAVTGAVVAENAAARMGQSTIVVWNDSRRRCYCVGIDLSRQRGPFNVHRSSRLVRLPDE